MVDHSKLEDQQLNKNYVTESRRHTGALVECLMRTVTFDAPVKWDQSEFRHNVLYGKHE